MWVREVLAKEEAWFSVRHTWLPTRSQEDLRGTHEVTGGLTGNPRGHTRTYGSHTYKVNGVILQHTLPLHIVYPCLCLVKYQVYTFKTFDYRCDDSNTQH